MGGNDGEALPTVTKEIPPELQGLRMTKQRREVYGVLLQKRDHPTANEVFRRVQADLPTISLATVYNCLDALVDHGLINRVNFDREPSRFCVNRTPHVHFQDKTTGMIHDLSFKDGCQITDVLDLPNGVEMSELELTIRGFLLKGS